MQPQRAAFFGRPKADLQQPLLAEGAEYSSRHLLPGPSHSECPVVHPKLTVVSGNYRASENG
jgi:hypothetical protein